MAKKATFVQTEGAAADPRAGRTFITYEDGAEIDVTGFELVEGKAFITKIINPHKGAFVTKRQTWLKVTPSLCLECGYDTSVQKPLNAPVSDPMYGLIGYDGIPTDIMFDERMTVREYAIHLLAQHKAEKHGPLTTLTPESPAAVRARKKKALVASGQYIQVPKFT